MSPAPAATASPPDWARTVLGRLFPPPLQVGPGAGSGPGGFLVLPTAARPRLVVPAGSRRAAARAVSRQLTGRRARTRAARVATTLAVATGVADRLAGRLQVHGPSGADSVLRRLAPVLGCDDLLLTMPVGPPRATRKPVLQVTDRDGRVLAFVKVGHDDLTARLVAGEGAALARLAGRGLGAVRAPRPLADLRWNGLVLLVLEPLPLADGRRLQGAAARAALLEVVRDIAGAGGRAAAAAPAGAFAAALRARLADGGPGARGLLSACDALPRDLPALRLGSWHGDLNPGNVALRAAGPLVWDWERYEDAVPVGFDLLHHDLHRDITERGAAARSAADRLLEGAAETLRPLGVEPAAADATARLYLLALGARYLGDRQAEAGAVLGLVDTWIVPALAARTAGQRA